MARRSAATARSPASGAAPRRSPPAGAPVYFEKRSGASATCIDRDRPRPPDEVHRRTGGDRGTRLDDRRLSRRSRARIHPFGPIMIEVGQVMASQSDHARSRAQRARRLRRRDGDGAVPHRLQHDDLRSAGLLRRHRRSRRQHHRAEYRRLADLPRRSRRGGDGRRSKSTDATALRPATCWSATIRRSAASISTTSSSSRRSSTTAKFVAFPALRAHWVDVGGGSRGFGSTSSRRHLRRRSAVCARSRCTRPANRTTKRCA